MNVRIRSATRLLTAWIVLALCLTGCWGSRELNSLSIVLAMGIDKIGEEYEVSVQIVDASQMTRNRLADRFPVVVYTIRAPTVLEALRRYTAESSRKLYFSHMRFVIFGEQIAKEGIRNAIDLLFRDFSIRPDFHVAIVRGNNAKSMLSLVTPTEILPAMDLYKSLKLSEREWAPSAAVNVLELMKVFSLEGMEPVLTGLRLTGDTEKSMSAENVKQPRTFGDYRYTGIGVLKGDRLVGWMNEKESKAFSYIQNRVSSTVARVPCPQSDGDFTVDLFYSKARIRPRVQDGRPSVYIRMDVQANIGEVGCRTDLKSQQAFLALQKAAGEGLEAVISNGIRRAQNDFGADIFGFGEQFHRSYPKQWRQWKADWNRRFRELPVEIDVHYQLRQFGKIINEFGSTPAKET